MRGAAVEFISEDGAFLLKYEPKDGTSWVHERLNRNETLTIKGTLPAGCAREISGAAPSASSASTESRLFIQSPGPRAAGWTAGL